MKQLKNTTGSTVSVDDVGQDITANQTFTIDPTQYQYYTRSSDVITLVGNGTLVVRDGNSDLSISDGIDFLKDLLNQQVNVKETAPFAAKKVTEAEVTYDLFKRVHGESSTSISAGSSQNIDHEVIYDLCKFTGAEIFGCELGDEVDYYILDDDTNTYSGLSVATHGANVQLNQFGFKVKMPDGPYKNTSQYDASLKVGMIVRCAYKNNGASAKTVHTNVELHEMVEE